MSTRPRDSYIDLLRGFSLGVVVLCHLGFTVVQWSSTGPHTTSPFEFVPGLWIVTWVLQVLPLFFYIGGYAHLASWRSYRGSLTRFTLNRLCRLLLPAVAVAAVWALIGIGLSFTYPVDVATRVVKLVLSPLWFVGVYALLVALLPLALWLHRKLGLWALVLFGAGAIAVDVARFTFGWEAIGYANLVFVWGLAHQAGLSHERWRALSKRASIAFVATGLATLTVLVVGFEYPGAMVGVPGRAFSNMNPPTLAIAALLFVQIGLIALPRPAAERWLARPGPALAVRTANRYGLPVFLFHTTGAALFLFTLYRVFGHALVHATSDLDWLLTRPLMLLGAGAFTAILVAATTKRRKVKSGPRPVPVRPSRSD